LETWRRNLYVVWAAELVAIAGFSVAFPFLPYYVQELGVTDLQQAELWSGVLVAVQAVTMTIFSPIWGVVADRYGRKLMIERAMFGGAVVLAAMALVQNVQQLVILRALQGVLTGTVAAAMSLVASTTPREKSGYALGLLQMAIWIGSSVGPLIGGVVADTWGYRAVFWVTGGLLLVAGLTVWRFVHEDFTPVQRDRSTTSGGAWDGLKVVLSTSGLAALFAVRIGMRLGTSLTVPILSLFIQSLVPTTARVASLTGLISGVTAATSAVSAVILGQATDRRGYRSLLIVCIAAAAALWLPQAFVTGPWQLLILQAAVGFFSGGMLAAATTGMANLSPEGRQGAVYGLDAGAVSAASAVGPLIGASVAAAWGLRVPFVLTAAVLAVTAGLAWVLVPKDTTLRTSPESG
jgi:DHA1 family multidrug resistance protein-like MFS transporter